MTVLAALKDRIPTGWALANVMHHFSEYNHQKAFNARQG